MVREVGDSLYFEAVGEPDGVRTSGEVSKVGSGWKGEMTMQFTCQYQVSGFWEVKVKTRACRLPFQVEVNEATPSHIKGRSQAFPDGLTATKKNCKNCYKNVNLVWGEFVLVRPD